MKPSNVNPNEYSDKTVQIYFLIYIFLIAFIILKNNFRKL